MPGADGRWNLNIHYHRIVLDAVPGHARTALDVGSGDGLLAFDLADRGLQVTGIDCDAPSVARARADHRADERARFVVGDLFDHAFEPASFDVVASIATLHHVDAVAGLRRLRSLVRPGGVLVVVGFARPSSSGDRLRAVAGTVYKRGHQMRRRYWEHHAPTSWPPPLTTSEMAEVVRRELPGATFRRLLSLRYAVVWTSAGGGS